MQSSDLRQCNSQKYHHLSSDYPLIFCNSTPVCHHPMLSPTISLPPLNSFSRIHSPHWKSLQSLIIRIILVYHEGIRLLMSLSYWIYHHIGLPLQESLI